MPFNDNDLPETPIARELRPDDQTNQALNRRTRRGFLTAAIATAAGYAGWHWLRTRPLDGGALWPLRRSFQANEKVSRSIFNTVSRAKELPAGTATPNPRVNGDIGLENEIDVAKWKLRVSGLRDGNVVLTLDNIKSLPKVRMTSQLCCIEGWSIFVNWAGVRFTDFIKKYPPKTRSGRPADPANTDDLLNYVAMATPDFGYYVGLDIASAVHPQTMLAYEIDDRPLTPEHGAPLRLVIPSKYGIKNIKRIGSIEFTDTRPDDYWAQTGYDWYSGL